MSMLQDFGNSFIEKISSPEGQQKAAELGGKFILDRLRERAFSRGILDAKPVRPDECQISTDHDTLTKIEFIEPKARAMTMAFGGNATTQEIRMDRAQMGFHTISSAVFQKTEQELQIYRNIPVTKIIEDNSLKDIEELEDRGFLLYCDIAVQFMQAEANSAASAPTLNASALKSNSPPVEFSVVKGEAARNASSNTGASFMLTKPDIVTLRNTLTDNRLRGAKLLMTESDWNAVGAWTLEDTGSSAQTEILVSGYKQNTLLGLQVIRSIKNDMLRKGNVYLFTDPGFLGRFYILNTTKFYVDKRYNMISWQAWEDVGMMLLNIASVKKLELYAADATANDADSIRSRFVPKDVSDLFAPNNRVSSGGMAPAISAL